jgi:hypothetical protein
MYLNILKVVYGGVKEKREERSLSRQTSVPDFSVTIRD